MPSFSRAGAPQGLSSSKQRDCGFPEHAQGQVIPAPTCPWHLDVLLLPREGGGKRDCLGDAAAKAPRVEEQPAVYGSVLPCRKAVAGSAVLGY